MNMYVAGGAFKVYTNGNNERLRITSDGLVGIATAIPPDWCRFSIDHGQYGLTRFSNHSHLLLQNNT